MKLTAEIWGRILVPMTGRPLGYAEFAVDLMKGSNGGCGHAAAAENNGYGIPRVPGPAYFAYDAAGNRTMTQDGSGTTYWSYDALNRITNEEGNQ